MNSSSVTSQERRENAEPYEGRGPIPWFVVVLVACLTAFCIAYIVGSTVDTPSAWGDGRTRAELAGARAGTPVGVDGAALFAANCVPCHQVNGEGLPGLFPPLAGSEWVAGKDTTLAAIVLHGISGPISVKGSSYAGAMPAFKDRFADEQLAAVLTHVRTQWGNRGGAIDASMLAAVRERSRARTEPFSGGDELSALP